MDTSYTLLKIDSWNELNINLFTELLNKGEVEVKGEDLQSIRDNDGFFRINGISITVGGVQRGINSVWFFSHIFHNIDLSACGPPSPRTSCFTPGCASPPALAASSAPPSRHATALTSCLRQPAQA